MLFRVRPNFTLKINVVSFFDAFWIESAAKE